MSAPPPGSDPLLQAIGRVAAEYSRYETVFAQVFTLVLTDNADVGLTVFQALPSEGRLTVFRVAYLAAFQNGPAIERLTNFLVQAEAVGEERNEIVHGSWELITPESDKVSWFLRRRNKKTGYKDDRLVLSIAEVDAVAAKIQALIDVLTEIAIDWSNTRG